MGNDARTQQLFDWCASRLGPGELVQLVPAAGGQMSNVYRYLMEANSAVVKVRSEPLERVKRCLDAQRLAARNGFPCAMPLGEAEALDATGVVSSEEWRPGGEMLRGHDGDSARRSAILLAELVALLERRPAKALDPPPPWMNWNPPGGGLWPPNGPIDRMDQAPVPDIIRECARRAASRLRRSALPHVLGHGDWEAQNIRWKDGRPWSVYDWDSLVSLPEAAIVGAASGAFASTEVPTLAPIGSSDIFLDSYESARARTFSDDEREIAWAASMWPALHNARGEHLFRSDPVASVAVLEQSEERLNLAKA
ncbi:phosphotransferase [Arthrobacter sp. NPDC093128]|uniref:phosphotransferase n=1 Tax=Arthrobacter sp. NPDC093128 TaxID=3154979 RepID=UPI00344599DB